MSALERELGDAERRLAARRGEAQRRHLHHQLRLWLASPDLDRLAHSRIERILGVELPAWQAEPLGVGEAFLPLVIGAGTVVRLVVRSRPGALMQLGRCFAGVHAHAWAAVQGLLQTLTELGCGHPTDEVAVETPLESNALEGASFGLPLCVALVSRALDVAPRDGVASTAAVQASGRLSPVLGLDEKMTALRERWPNVHTLVVARSQDAPTDLRGLSLVRCESLAHALPHFGLAPTPARLPIAQDDLEPQLDAIKHLHRKNRADTPWLQVAHRAEWLAARCAVSARPFLGAQALGWAALAALHGGDEARAQDLIRRVKQEDTAHLSEEARVWHHLIDATARIDRRPDGPSEAIALAEQALDTCAKVSTQVRLELEGRAYGTLGRALMHAGRMEEALGPLHRGTEHHRRHGMQREIARSQTYEAICLRLLGHAEEALLLVAEALGGAGVDPTSRLYLGLEHGRALLACRHAADAARVLEDVAAAQPRPQDYPRLGATRSLACALRRADRHLASRVALSECRQIWEDDHVPRTLRRVAVLAAGDALVDLSDGLVVDLPEQALRAAWSEHFGQAEPDAIRRALEKEVY